MKRIEIPMNVRVKVGKRKVKVNNRNFGEFIIEVKHTPQFIMLFYLSMRIFWLSLKGLIRTI